MIFALIGGDEIKEWCMHNISSNAADALDGHGGLDTIRAFMILYVRMIVSNDSLTIAERF